MAPIYSRQSRSLAKARLSGPQSPALNGDNSLLGDNAKRNGRRVIRLTSRSSNNNRGQETAEEEESGEKEITTNELKEDEAEEETKLYQRWAEEYYEVVEQLPLELHRTFALMRELENKMQERITFVAEHTKLYRDARLKLKSQRQKEHEQQESHTDEQQQYHNASDSIVHPDYGTSSEQDAEGEDDEIFHEVESSKTEIPPLPADDPLPSISTPQANRLSMLATIANASSEAIRAAEEKVGLAVTAYDWVDRHIRRLDGDLQRSESTLLLGLRAGTEASRGVRDALGISDGDNAYNRNGAGTTWEDDSMMSNQSTPMPGVLARKSKAGMNSVEDSNNDQLSTALMADMAIDPNEPKYCYCDEVSSGDMVACDNEDCPREWFHYHCLGLTSPPKGTWFCLFCVGPGRKTSGTYPHDAPCLPPGYGSRRSEGSVSNHKKKKKSSSSSSSSSSSKKRKR